MNSDQTVVEILTRYAACSDAIQWAKATKGTPAQVWRKCERADWLLWVAEKLVDHKMVVRAACDVARVAIAKHLKGEDRKVVEAPLVVIERWAQGKATDTEMRTARDEAWRMRSRLWFPVTAAVAAAADAAAYSGTAAPDAVAAYADADAIARKQTLKELCVVVRLRIPWAAVAKALKEAN